ATPIGWKGLFASAAAGIAILVIGTCLAGLRSLQSKTMAVSTVSEGAATAIERLRFELWQSELDARAALAGGVPADRAFAADGRGPGGRLVDVSGLFSADSEWRRETAALRD